MCRRHSCLLYRRFSNLLGRHSDGLPTGKSATQQTRMSAAPVIMNASLHIILVTAPNVEVGRKLAAAILQSRVAACVNIVPGLESHYWWEGKIDQSNEVLLLIKTTKTKLKALEKVV